VTVAPEAPTGSDADRTGSVVEELASGLRAASGDSIAAILLYGSHLLKTNPDRHSAVDFVVVVDDYDAFYRALARAGHLHRPVFLMKLLARVLPPNSLAFAPDDGRGGIVKYQLISRAHFERALGPRHPDHFVLGRMLQRVGIVWRRDEETERWVRTLIAEAHRGVVDWMAPYLDEPVDVDGFGRRMLEVCYASEFRPESTARAGRVYEAQAEHLRDALEPALEEAVARGVLRREGVRYALAAEVPSRERRRLRRYFRMSKARTTSRWFKHIVTFVNWLPYIVRKVERHTGRTIHLTALERAVPIVFLWPRVVHTLLTRPRKEIES